MTCYYQGIMSYCLTANEGFERYSVINLTRKEILSNIIFALIAPERDVSG